MTVSIGALKLALSEIGKVDYSHFWDTRYSDEVETQEETTEQTPGEPVEVEAE